MQILLFWRGWTHRVGSSANLKITKCFQRKQMVPYTPLLAPPPPTTTTPPPPPPHTHTPWIFSFSTAVTLKIRSRSPKSKQFFIMFQLHIHENSVRIQPLIQKLLYRQVTEFSVFLLLWPWKLGQGHQNLIVLCYVPIIYPWNIGNLTTGSQDIVQTRKCWCQRAPQQNRYVLPLVGGGTNMSPSL